MGFSPTPPIITALAECYANRPVHLRAHNQTLGGIGEAKKAELKILNAIPIVQKTFNSMQLTKYNELIQAFHKLGVELYNEKIELSKVLTSATDRKLAEQSLRSYEHFHFHKEGFFGLWKAFKIPATIYPRNNRDPPLAYDEGEMALDLVEALQRIGEDQFRDEHEFPLPHNRLSPKIEKRVADKKLEAAAETQEAQELGVGVKGAGADAKNNSKAGGKGEKRKQSGQNSSSSEAVDLTADNDGSALQKFRKASDEAKEKALVSSGCLEDGIDAFLGHTIKMDLEELRMKKEQASAASPTDAIWEILKDTTGHKKEGGTDAINAVLEEYGCIKARHCRMLFRNDGVLDTIKSALKPVGAMELDELVTELQSVPRPAAVSPTIAYGPSQMYTPYPTVPPAGLGSAFYPMVYGSVSGYGYCQ